MSVFFKAVTTTDNCQSFTLGDVCNLTVKNLDLANRVVLSSTQQGVANVGIVGANSTVNLDQNRFSIGENNILYVRSEVPGSPSNIFIFAW